MTLLSIINFEELLKSIVIMLSRARRDSWSRLMNDNVNNSFIAGWRSGSTPSPLSTLSKNTKSL